MRCIRVIDFGRHPVRFGWAVFVTDCHTLPGGRIADAHWLRMRVDRERVMQAMKRPKPIEPQKVRGVVPGVASPPVVASAGVLCPPRRVTIVFLKTTRIDCAIRGSSVIEGARIALPEAQACVALGLAPLLQNLTHTTCVLPSTALVRSLAESRLPRFHSGPPTTCRHIST